MPKATCIRRCQLHGVREPGEIVTLTEEELKHPRVKASFRLITEAEQAKASEKAATDKAPLKDKAGNPLPPGGQMQTDEIKRKLASLGVLFKESADRQELFALLQDALKPPTDTKPPAGPEVK